MIVASLLRRSIALYAIVVFAAATREPGATCRAQTSPAARAAKPNDELLAEGVAALERGDASTARDLLERALAADPHSAEAHTYLGVLADRAGDLNDAERHFALAARLAPQSARTRNNYGAILLRLNRTGEAAAEFEASLRLDPDQAKALVNLAQIRFDSHTPEGLRAAEDLFRRADALAPDAEIARALTVIALRCNDRERAADYYRAYAKRLAGAGDNPPDAAVRSELGGALLEAGLLDEAALELKAALALDASNADTVVRLARVYLARKDIPAAGRTLEAALARKVEAPAIYALLAVAYEKSGHIENAIPAMRLAIQLDPQSEKYRFQYAILLTDANAPAAALIRLNEALQSFPKSVRLWLALGLANLKMSNNSEAAQAFNHAIELDPEFAQGYACLGMTRVAAGQYEAGARLYEQALQRNPKIAVVHYLLADALLRKADADSARIDTHLKQAIQMDATYAPARLALGKLYARAEHLPEAVVEFERVVGLDPNLAEAYYQLGRAYSRLKRTAEAQAALTTFKRLSDAQKEQEQKEQREIIRRLADVLF